MSGEHLPQGSSAELDDKPREACGVFGIYAPGLPVAEFTYMGLSNLQHRGQEGAGIAISRNGSLEPPVVGFGLLEEALHSGSDIRGFSGADIALGHVRYGTSDGSDALQPMAGKGFALSHNGHIVNAQDLMSKLGIKEAVAKTDSRLIERLMTTILKDNPNYDLVDALAFSAQQLEGAYSLVVMGNDKLYGMRDRHGFRPLVLGEIPDKGWVLASEIPALDIVGASFSREVAPGEIIEIGPGGQRSYRQYTPDPKTCSFEYFYFSRPENIINEQLVADSRIRLGEQLWAEETEGFEADAVLDVPDSGTIAAIGYSTASNIPYLPGAIVKNRYSHRNFITPGQIKREHDLRKKFNFTPSLLEGKRVVVIDDSIIRGTTTKGIVHQLFSAGAKEVHVRITSSPYKYPCVYGMATGDQTELTAAKKSPGQIRRDIKATSLHFLSVEGIKIALGPVAGKVCMACMTGDYPTAVPREIFKVKAPPGQER